MTILRPSPIDDWPTPTSVTQAETEDVLRKHIPENQPFPNLQKSAHMQYLVRNLMQGFPARYTSQDASQPWLLFWTIQAFSVLQVALDPGNKQRTIDKIMTWQHPDGGFGGGPGQAAHLLPTYASVCTLAIVGRPGPRGGWDQIDRQKMYKFFMSLKQPDGSFLVTHHAEVDVRGIYCLLVSATLLDLMTPELVEGTAAFPYYSLDSTLLSSPRPPLGEAHGGYTFCSLASWVLLQPFINSSTPNAPKINLNSITRWLVQVQGTEVELGGFKGRTNKLVDGCYSWWCGGSFALLEALGVGGSQNNLSTKGGGNATVDPDLDPTEDEAWDDADESLFNRKALQEYILYASQHPAGGLRDKPPKHADAYHTLYCLSGLSAAQHHVFPSPDRCTEVSGTWVSGTDATMPDRLRKRVFTDALSWIEEEGGSIVIGGKDNRLNATHPIFNITITHSEAIMAHFYGQSVPARKLKGGRS